jgi:DHA1 family inner membrane transport protein
MSIGSANAMPPVEGRLLGPYALFAFTLGFGWFVLAPLVPAQAAAMHVSISAILLLISMYGYTMVVGALPAGFYVGRRGPGPSLVMAALLTFVGLTVRALATSFDVLLAGQIVAALAYPFLIAPIGSVLRLSGVRATKTGTGLVIGTLFFGMASGAVIGGHLGLSSGLWVAVVLNILAGGFLAMQASRVEPNAQSSIGPLRISVHPRWVVGFVVASTSVMFGSVATTALIHLNISQALVVGGNLTALTFLGSAVGAALFGFIGQRMDAASDGLERALGVATLVFTLIAAALLTGVVSFSGSAIDPVFLLLGLFGNAWYTLALEDSARAARHAGAAGLATAGYSLASNVGVAIVPVVLGPLVVSAGGAWLAITAALVAAGVAVALFTRGDAPPAEAV